MPVQDTDPSSITVEEWARAPEPLASLIERAKSDRRSAEAYAETKNEIDGRIKSLRRLRSARSLTQATIGELLGMSQSEVSRLEKRSDVLLSTLRRFVEATGGDLHLVVSYPDSPPVELVSPGDESASARSR